jgi:hypothetical protein
MHVVMEPVVDTRNKAAPNQKHNSHVIELVSPFRYWERMIRDGVVGCTHPQTCRGAGKEAAEDKDIL